eukprot:1824020-Pyramimonas_sp.AAC.1
MNLERPRTCMCHDADARERTTPPVLLRPHLTSSTSSPSSLLPPSHPQILTPLLLSILIPVC